MRPAGPLTGVTVVALEQAVAAPFATRQLADLGARVIKVERPGAGDFARGYDTAVKGEASYFVWINRSKESITLDLKQEPAREALVRAIRRADVFIYNLAPGAAARLGLTSLREDQPELITCSITGYGDAGPLQHRKAYDLLVQAESGLMSITGPQDTPSRVGASVADISAGMYAYSGILAALLARAQSGVGTHLEVSLLDSITEWLTQPAYYAHYSDSAPPRSGPFHATIAPYGPVRVGSGETLMLGLQNEREWRAFCEQVLEDPALTDDPRFNTNSQRVANRQALQELMEHAFAGQGAAAVMALLERVGIAYSSMRGVGELVHHPQHVARQRLREVALPADGDSFEALLPPVQTDAWEYRMDPVPALGAHTDAVLTELGYSPQEIDAMRATGAI